MKRKFSALLLAFVMVLSAVLQPLPVHAEEVSGENYVVTLPDGYNEAKSYPVVYVMPQNGYDTDDSGIVGKFDDAVANGIGTNVIIVRPSFTEGEDLHAAMNALVAEIDANYSTIPDSSHRLVVGTGVGGYLAYILGLTEASYPVVEAEPVEEGEEAEELSEEPEVVSLPEISTLSAPKLFKYVAAIRGDFASESNPWLGTYGDVYSYLETMGSTKLAAFYTYMDAPVDDVYTNMTHSSNDIGALGIRQGLSASCHEYTVRSGSFTDSFLTESVYRIADRMTSNIIAGVASGSVSLTKAALPSDVEKAEVNYTVNFSSALSGFSTVNEDVVVYISVIDPNGNNVLTAVQEEKTAAAGTTLTGTVEVDNLVVGSSSTIQLSVKVLGAELVLATTTLTRIQDTVVDGDFQYIDLMGDWYFHFTGNKTGLDVEALLTSKDYEGWSVVQPGLAWWTKGFGDVTSLYPGSYFDYGIIGDGYYVKTFEVPENFDAEELILSVGNMDDRGQAFINGQLVGETGMENGVATGDSTWAIYSAYEIDPAVLKKGETNTIVVRCQNDGMGGGGWYAGPIALYSKTAFESDESTTSLFTEDSFESKYAASAQGLEGTVDNKYLVYVPDGYYDSEKYYPTVYLMHQYNSDHTSYIIDDVDVLIDEAIKQALIDEMIVVVPNSSESSWWRGDWMKMVTEELVPLIDANYRTIDDARYRFTAGCSMGGQGAYGVALTNPDLFSGAISFFGAFSMGGDASPNNIAKKETAEYLDYFTMYFICGNQDVYGFGEPAIELNQILEEKGVEHEFFIENGGHDSPFYLPYFVEAFIYTRDNMYKSDDVVETLMSGAVTVNGTKITVDFNALAGIEEYYNLIPASSYTDNATPDLSLPLIIEVEQNGEKVFRTVERDHAINTGDVTDTYTYDLSDVVDTTKEYSVTYKVAVFDRIVELKNVKVSNGQIVDDGSGSTTPTTPTNPSTPTTPTKPSTPSGNGGNSVDTGDHAPITLYLGLALAAFATMAVTIKLRRRS